MKKNPGLNNYFMIYYHPLKAGADSFSKIIIKKKVNHKIFKKKSSYSINMLTSISVIKCLAYGGRPLYYSHVFQSPLRHSRLLDRFLYEFGFLHHMLQNKNRMATIETTGQLQKQHFHYFKDKSS